MAANSSLRCMCISPPHGKPQTGQRSLAEAEAKVAWAATQAKPTRDGKLDKEGPRSKGATPGEQSEMERRFFAYLSGGAGCVTTAAR